MKKLIYIVILLQVSITVKAQTDSIHSVELKEATVIAPEQTELPTHTILIPTSADKTHSANAFDLLHRMNVSGIEIPHGSKQIHNNLGQEIVLCINGVEVSAQEIAALRSKNVLSMEYLRNPTGKYVGKGGVLNFKTIQYNYGGNVYLSAKESFLYNSGEYLVAADYSQKKSTLSLIYSNDWDSPRGKQIVDNHYLFTSKNELTRYADITPIKSKNIANTLNLRYSHTGENHRLSVVAGFSDTYMPYRCQLQHTNYSGLIQDTATVSNQSRSYGISFSTQTNYTLWLPKEQILDFSANISSGKNNYHYYYAETHQADIQSTAKEDNLYIAGTFQYSKTLRNKMKLAAILNHYYMGFKDSYVGSVTDWQKLDENVSSVKFQFSQSANRLYYYMTAGFSNMYTRQNDEDYNYFNPTAFYGANYSMNSSSSLSFNGYYLHTYFEPSYKNSVSLPTSFFEVTQGNPDLKPIKVLSNTVEFNHKWKKTSLTASYMNYIYFDNTLHVYSADNNYIYNRISNDGNFYGNMLSLTLTQSLLNDKLKVSLKGIEEYNSLRGDVYDMHKNIIRGVFKVDYTLNKMRVGAELRTPHKALDIREPFFIKKPMAMSIYTMWDWRKWRLEANVNNPFSKYHVTERYMDYPCFNMYVKDYSTLAGRSISIKAVFNFNYGKKTESSSYTVRRVLNSAILKSY